MIVTQFALCDLAVPVVVWAAVAGSAMLVIVIAPRRVHKRLALDARTSRVIRPIALGVAVCAVAVVVVFATGAVDLCPAMLTMR